MSCPCISTGWAPSWHLPWSLTPLGAVNLGGGGRIGSPSHDSCALALTSTVLSEALALTLLELHFGLLEWSTSTARVVSWPVILSGTRKIYIFFWSQTATIICGSDFGISACQKRTWLMATHLTDDSTRTSETCCSMLPHLGIWPLQLGCTRLLDWRCCLYVCCHPTLQALANCLADKGCCVWFTALATTFQLDHLIQMHVHYNENIQAAANVKTNGSSDFNKTYFP